MRTGELKPSLFSALFCSVEVAQYILFILGYLDTLHTRLHVFWAECTSRESTNCAVCEPVHQLLTDAVQTPVAANTQSYKYTKTQRTKTHIFQYVTCAVQTGMVVAGVCNLHCKWKLLYRDLVKCDKDSNNVSERGVVIFFHPDHPDLLWGYL